MELYQIKTFVMVARTGNLTRAAEKLNTTPPSVSNHIKQLEEKHNVSLFTRTPRGMKITSQGKILEQKARAILDAVGQFSRAANSLEQMLKGFLHLGINADPDYLKIPLIVNHLFKHTPDLNLEIIPSNTGEVLKGVEQERFDCGYVFGAHDHPGLEFYELAGVDLKVALPIQFQETHAREGWKEIADLPWIVPTSLCPFLDQVTQILSANNLSLKNKVFANDDITKTAFINQGIAVTVLEKKEAALFEKSGKVFLWTCHDPILSTLSLVYSKQKAQDLLVKTLVTVIRDIWATA